MTSKSENMKGNTRAQKTYPRDGRIHSRFNKDLLTRVKTERLNGRSLADYLEDLVLADLNPGMTLETIQQVEIYDTPEQLAEALQQPS